MLVAGATVFFDWNNKEEWEVSQKWTVVVERNGAIWAGKPGTTICFVLEEKIF